MYKKTRRHIARMVYVVFVCTDCTQKLRNIYEFEKLHMNSKVGRKFEESSQFLNFDKYYMFFKRS